MPPLCEAAGKGRTAVVEMLVKAGADVNKVSYVHVHVGCEEVLHVHVHLKKHVLLYIDSFGIVNTE